MFNKKTTGIDWPKDQSLFPLSNRYIVMDVETMNPYSDVIQLAAVEIVNGKIQKQLFKNIKPVCKSYNPFCQKVHGITFNDVKFEKTFKQFSPELINFIGKSPILAHNRPAEYKSLLFEYNQARILFPFYIGDFYCTMKMAKNLGLTGKLREMAQQVGIKTHHLRKEHDALSDTIIAAELFIEMQKIKRK